MNQDESDKQTHFCSLLDFLFDIFQDRKGFLFCRLGQVQMSNFLCAELNADTCRQKPLCQLIYPEFGT